MGVHEENRRNARDCHTLFVINVFKTNSKRIMRNRVDKLFLWGKFKMVKGKMVKVWLKNPMTKDVMLMKHETYRHNCKEYSKSTNEE